MAQGPNTIPSLRTFALEGLARSCGSGLPPKACNFNWSAFVAVEGAVGQVVFELAMVRRDMAVNKPLRLTKDVGPGTVLVKMPRLPAVLTG